MDWLFYVLLVFVAICMIAGARKGFVRTAVSMVFMILVMVVASWLNPYVGKFLRENTPVYKAIQEQCGNVISSYIESQGSKDADKLNSTEGGREGALGYMEDSERESQKADEVQTEIPVAQQVELLENAPIPKAMQQYLLQNNNSEIYQLLGVDKFVDYVANYIAYGITNGIGFLISFTLATIIVKIILYAVDLLTSLPGISFINALGGLLLGGVQGILWIWVFFIIVTVLCNTAIGKSLLSAIEGSTILSYLYDKNQLLQVIMAIMSGK